MNILNLFRKKEDKILPDDYVIIHDEDEDITIPQLKRYLTGDDALIVLRMLSKEHGLDLIGDFDRLYTSAPINRYENISVYRRLKEYSEEYNKKLAQVIKYKILDGEDIEEEQKKYAHNIAKICYYDYIIKNTDYFISEISTIQFFIQFIKENTYVVKFPKIVKSAGEKHNVREKLLSFTKTLLDLSSYDKIKIYTDGLSDELVIFVECLEEYDENGWPDFIEIYVKGYKVMKRSD